MAPSRECLICHPPSSNCDGRLHGTWLRPVWQSPDLRVESCLLTGSFLSSCPAGTNPLHPYVGASFSVSSRSAYKVSTAAFVVTPASGCGAVKCASSFLFAPVSTGAGLSRFFRNPANSSRRAFASVVCLRRASSFYFQFYLQFYRYVYVLLMDSRAETAGAACEVPICSALPVGTTLVHHIHHHHYCEAPQSISYRPVPQGAPNRPHPSVCESSPNV